MDRIQKPSDSEPSTCGLPSHLEQANDILASHAVGIKFKIFRDVTRFIISTTKLYEAGISETGTGNGWSSVQISAGTTAILTQVFRD
jgi:hypothetical protein